MTTYYKVLGPGGTIVHGGRGQWSLPTADGPGEWMPSIEPRLCESGYHFLNRDQLVQWLHGEIYELEIAPGATVIHDTDKSVCSSARLVRRLYADTWTERTQRLFAADCAESVLPSFEKKYPNDPRPRNAILAARQFARGEIPAATARDAATAATAAAAAAAATAHNAYDAAIAAAAAAATARAAAYNAYDAYVAADAAAAAAATARAVAATVRAAYHASAAAHAAPAASAAYAASAASAAASDAHAARAAAAATARNAAATAATAYDAATAVQTELLFDYLEGQK